MAIPQQHIDSAKQKLEQINSWFQQQVASNPAAVISLVAQRATRIEQEIYATYRNSRRGELEAQRDDNTIRLRAEAGRAAPFGDIPRDSKRGTVQADSIDWMNAPDENHVHVHSSLEGSHSVSVSEDRSTVTFAVKCKGAAFEDTTRGSGWHEATLHAVYRRRPEALDRIVNGEQIELGHIIGV